MSEALKLAQRLETVCKADDPWVDSDIRFRDAVETVAAALIDLHERMGKIAEEAGKHHEDFCASHYSEDPPCDCQVSVILALTKGTPK